MAPAKYVLRHLPGVTELEVRLQRIEAHPNPEWAPEMDGLLEQVDRVSRRLFGLDRKDVREIDFADDEYEKIKADLMERGWDLSDGCGMQLMCVDYLLVPMAFATDGQIGRLPDEPPTDIEVLERSEEWGDDLEDDVQRWRRQRR